MSTRSQRLLHDILREAADHAEKPAIVVEGEAHTYAELLDTSNRLAAALQERGLERGDRVVLFMDNTFACCATIFAVLLAGGVFVVVNRQTKSDKLAYIIRDSGARFVVADSNLPGTLNDAVSACTDVRTLIVTGSAEATTHLAVPFESFTRVVESGSASPRESAVISVDLAALIYTSGSTGKPKGVMLTHRAMGFVLGSLIEYLRLSSEHRILNVLPMAFDYGLYQLFMAIGARATLVLERSFVYPATVLQRMQDERVTVFPGVPTVYAVLMSLHAKKKLCFPSVERVTNTAAALPPGFLPALREMFPNALIFSMYGLTECKRVAYLEPELLDERPTSVGKAIPGTEAFILTSDGKPARAGETGILHVRGDHLMSGYWNLPEQTARMLKPGRHPGERVLCTQDHFRCDEDGFLYFVGRSDDIIKTRGEKVSPVEVENVLHGIAGVREAAVIGVPDEILGQAIRAYVVLDRGFAYTEKQLIKLCIAKLESFMVPKEIVFRTELPKTGSGKITKTGLAV